jgi:hypothetical protein
MIAGRTRYRFFGWIYFEKICAALIIKTLNLPTKTAQPLS